MDKDTAYTELVLQHKEEKEILRTLEKTENYKIHNPVLISQRDKVRRLKDKLIFLEEEKTYIQRKRKCVFTNCLTVDGVDTPNPKCQKTINYDLKTWIPFGNCCKSCNKIFNKDLEEAGAIEYSL